MGRLLLLGAMLSIPSSALARPDFVSLVPNADLKSCQTCHLGQPPNFNPFGRAVFENALDRSAGTSIVRWSPLIANLDSDGDGVSNGAELGDPAGSWRPGQPAPGNRADVTEPGNANSVPSTPASAPALGLLGLLWLGASLIALGLMAQLRQRRSA